MEIDVHKSININFIWLVFYSNSLYSNLLNITFAGRLWIYPFTTIVKSQTLDLIRGFRVCEVQSVECRVS